MGDSNKLVVRIYVKHNVLKSLKEKFLGGIACLTQEMGAAHVAIQISNRIVHWLGCSFALVKDWHGAAATALFYPQDCQSNEVEYLVCNEKMKDDIARLIQKWNCEVMYDSLKSNCQKFVSEMLKKMGLLDTFSSYQGYIGEFIDYISKYDKMKEEFYPCIIKNGKVLISWKIHKELDSWHEENKSDIESYLPLLRAFHRAFQLKGDYRSECPCGEPTKFYDENGKKKSSLNTVTKPISKMEFSSQVDNNENNVIPPLKQQNTKGNLLLLVLVHVMMKKKSCSMKWAPTTNSTKIVPPFKNVPENAATKNLEFSVGSITANIASMFFALLVPIIVLNSLSHTPHMIHSNRARKKPSATFASPTSPRCGKKNNSILSLFNIF
eukprot:TRINITY_DN435_c0_g1_i6.p1 TRINITY_DN435_c0_g1~~TRINITY_DN435_c0_g1_i6.p1  ORF type:complete len:381 (+),score=64.25 TRINITY_DN435_c0_g1_i6:254-1396(+)